MPDLSHLSDAKRILLQKCLSGDAGNSTEGKVRITPRARGNMAPLSLAQEQIWLHCQMTPPGIPVYNETLTIRRSGLLNLVALERTFAEIIRRHEIWRTTFELHEGQPVQVVHPAATGFRLPLIDLRGIPELEREREAERVAREAARAPFNLKEGPLLRAILMELSDCDYRLFLTFHQLIFDGVTAYQVFLPELAAIYLAFSQNQPSPLSEPGIQYADYAIWQREQPNPEVIAGQLAYWERKLVGELPVLEWPSDQFRPALQTYRGEIQPVVMSKELLQNLKTLGQEQGVSLFMILVAGLASVLHRYTGQADIILGAPTAGRTASELERMPGYFLNILPLRIDVSGDPTFQELLVRVRETVLGALSNSDIPLTQLVETIRPAPDPARNPFFQAAISVEPPIPAVDGEWSATQSDIATGASKLDLYIDVDERPEGIVGPVTYNPDVFEADAIRRLIQHWRTFLEGAAANPDRAVSKLPLLTASERRQILVDWNRTRADYPRIATIHQFFDAQAARTPEGLAVREGHTCLSFRELRERSNQLARFLQKMGVGRGTRVALRVERSLEMAVALLGILKTGAAYVPLDPSHPADRMQFMLEDAETTLLVTQSRVLNGFPFSKVKTVTLDTDWQRIAQESVSDLSTRVEPGDPAYVLYTSGTSGGPKGVEGTHGGAINRLWWMWERYPFHGGEVCCQKTNLGFVDSVWEIFGPLLAGIPSVILGPEVVRDPEQLLQSLAENQVTRMVLVPSLLRALLDHAPHLQERVPQLKLWSSSGEVLSGELVGRFRQGFPEATLLNIYGATEVAADVTWHEVGEEDVGVGTVPIGRPISNTQVYVLDGHGNPVPAGVRGEIYVGGEGLALGYWNRRELTEERFVENRIAPEESARLYRTGDLGRWRGDGEMEYVGRVDGEVKLRGMRIDLGEIEAALLAHVGVREAAVERVEEAGGEARLQAYVVAAEGERANARELRQHLRRKLPEHMVPARFVELEQFPRLASGKVNRRELAAAGGRRIWEQGMAVPGTVTERALAEIWKELLKVEEVGVEQNFFELGGHSLLVLQVMARIRRKFGLELPVRTVFEEPTIAGLATAVEKAQALGLNQAHTPILQSRSRAAEANASQAMRLIQSEKLSQLEKLSAEEARNLLRSLLDGKQDYELRS
jgi:amino acid adenylation domain-containing protein